MLNDELKKLLMAKGANLVGFADLREVAPEIRDNLPFGTSIATALNPEIISEIRGGPTKRYYEEYKRTNQLLNKLGGFAVKFFEQRGYKARRFAATHSERSKGFDSETLSTRLQHKTTATRAGLGWIGKCALLVTKEFGSAVRFTTVLTNAPITTGQPVNSSSCGHCTACVDICPGHAPKGKDWQLGMPREPLFDAFACQEAARELAMKLIAIPETICGLCIASCPWTKKYLKRAG
jgi:epoxyqueuosine reductase